MNPELAPYEALAKEILRRVMAEDTPEEVNEWIAEQVARMGGDVENTAMMTWPDSFEFTDNMLMEYERIANTPEAERKVLTWPWQSWRNLIDPLEPGMLAVLTAPDGQGKTIYAESLAEYWASKRHRVVFIHYELNRKLMMLRRTSRHTGISARDLKSGKLTQAQSVKVLETTPILKSWAGEISYLHTPGWSMEKTTAEIRKLHADGLCDVVVLDYLEKVGASRRQLQMFGANGFMREADNVEQLKNFAESAEIPVVMVAQMNKAAKGQSITSMDRSGMRGAGEKSDKANLVAMLKRDRTEEGYSNEVNVLIDKNTMGATGVFQQIMQPEYFRVGDIQKPY